MLKSKTMWFAIALSVLGILETQFTLLKPMIPDQYEGLLFVAIGAVVAALRVVTTKPLSEK